MRFLRHAKSFVKRELLRGWQPSGGGRKRREKVRLELESLEDRCVPTGGSWTPLQNPPLLGASNMMLLTDGTVMMQAPGGQTWYRLTPDSTGNYAKGTVSTMPLMHDTRDAFPSVMLPDGRVFVAGGEYGTGGNTAEIYDPQTNTWVSTPNGPLGDISDTPAKLLPDGRVLVGSDETAYTQIYNPATNSWSLGPPRTTETTSDEESWTLLPDGSILTADVFNYGQSERFIPSENRWVSAGTIPVNLSNGNYHEIGAGIQLDDGRVFYLGASGHTAFYTPGATVDALGSWAAGPDIPNGLVCDDAPAAILPNGDVLFVADTGPYTGPSALLEYSPTTNSFASISPPGGSLPYPAYTYTMLDLPSGQVLLTNGGGSVPQIFTPADPANHSAAPYNLSVTANADGSFHLTGAQINGVSEGAAYGDDAEMSSNYPIVRLTNAAGQVFYARTFNFSNTGLTIGSTLASADFTLPAGLAPGNYSLSVVANGIPSDPVSFNVSGYALVGKGDALSPVEGQTFNGAVAIFTDSNAADVAGNLSATIIWGDGSTSGGTVTGGNGAFTVNGSHIYAEEGNYPVRVVVNGPAGATGAVSGYADVSDADVFTGAGATLTIPTGQTLSGTVATFTDAHAGTPLQDLIATINWGDGTSSTGTVSGSASRYNVAGSHTYANTGTYSVHVTLQEQSPGTATTTAISTVTVTGTSDLLVADGLAIAPVAGQSFSGAVATFRDSNPATPAGAFAATINWGDGASSAGTVLGANGTFVVTGSHTYTQQGTDNPSVTIRLGNVSVTAQQPGVWSTAPNLTTGRSSPEVATGHDGKIYVFGGYNSSVAGAIVSSVAVFDPATGTWSTAGTMPTPRYGGAAVTGPDGRIYLIGGVTIGNYANTVDIFDPSTGNWTHAASLNTGRQNLAAVLGADGRIYALGGLTAGGVTNTVEVYNPATNQWTYVAPMSLSRTGLAAVVGADGRIYAIDGYTSGTSLGSYDTNSVEAYNPATNTWASVASMNTARESLSAVTGPDGRIYAIGGTDRQYDVFSSAEVYDPTTNTWAAGPGMTGYVFGTAVIAGDGRTYAVAGGPFGTFGPPTGVAVLTPSTITVAGSAALTGTAQSIAAVEQAGFSGTVATFNDIQTQDQASNFVATINWGDGTITTGVVSGGNGSFTVNGSHTYGVAGSYAVSVTLQQNAPGTASATVTSTANVADADAFQGTTDQSDTFAQVALVEGQSFTGTVATFTDSNLSATAGSLSATICWGDGTSSTGTVAAGTVTGTFTVWGSHTYLEEGKYTVSVTLGENAPGGAAATTTGYTVDIADGDIFVGTGAAVTANQGQTFNGTVMTFADTTANYVYVPNSTTTAELSATIIWGDGTTSVGTVTGGNGTFVVNGSHVYAAAGSYTITALIRENGPGCAIGSMTTTATIAGVSAPSVPVLAPASDSGISNSDDITNINTPTFTGTAQSGSTVTIFSDGVAVGSATVTGGTYSITVSALVDGTHQITAQAADAAGNTANSPGALAVTIDTTPPVAPSIEMASWTDSGLSSSDDITNVTTPAFIIGANGNLAEPGSSLIVYSDGVIVGTGTANSSGACTITVSPLAAGTHQLTVTATDAAGNTSAASSPLTVTIKTSTTPPSVPRLTAASDSGISNTDNITNVLYPTITGTAEAGSAVTLFIDGNKGGTLLATNGTYTVTIGLTPGTHRITTEAEDVAGNVADSTGALVVTVDTTPPTATLTSKPALYSASTSAIFAFTGSDNVTLVGSLTYLVSLDGSAFTAATSPKSYTGLAQGSHTFRVEAVDQAGNVSTPAAYTWTVDTAAPDTRITSKPAVVTSSTTASFAFTGTDNLTPATSLKFQVAIDAGAWTNATSPTTYTGLAQGSHMLRVRAIDQAGNIDGSPATYVWTVTSSQAGFTATDLGTLGGTSSYSTAVNATGQVAGYAYTAAGTYRAFLYSGGVMRDLGTLGGTYSYATGINANGDVIGYSYLAGNTVYHAFMYHAGVMTDLGTLAGSYSYAYGVNDLGQVVGYSATASGQYHAFLYSGGAMRDLGTLGGTTSYGTAINNSGQVTGYAFTATGTYHAFISSGGVMTDLGTLGGSYSYATGINASGQVIGYAYTAGNQSHAFLYSGGVMHDLGTLGGTGSYAYAVNNNGQVVGYAYTASGTYHAFLYSGGVMTDLGTLGGTTSYAQSINNAGQVVGYAYNATGASRPFLYSSAGAMYDLATLLPTNSAVTLSSVTRIDDAGQILGVGTVGGQSHAVLLTPNTASFQAVDTITQGNWKGAYGAGGYSIFQESQQLPAYASYSVGGASGYTWASSTSDTRALQKGAAGSTDRIAATDYSASSFSIDVAIKDGQAHQISVYALDWDGSNSRSERIDLVDPVTGRVLSTQTVSAFSGGEYLSWKVTGSVRIVVTRTGGANAVLSGLFFGT